MRWMGGNLWKPLKKCKKLLFKFVFRELKKRNAEKPTNSNSGHVIFWGQGKQFLAVTIIFNAA